MAKLTSLKTDSDLETNGVWVDWQMGVRLRIARAGNAAFDAKFQELQMPHLNGMRTGTLPEGMAELLLKEACAETILLDWGGIETDEGEPLPYSAQQALEFFQDEGLRDLYKFVLVTSQTFSHYRVRLDEEAAKN